MALPPLDAGGVKAIVACISPPVAVPMVGAPGMVAGVALLDAPEALPLPAALVATTVQVYGVPLVSPLTMTGDIVPPLLMPPQVAVYPVMGLPLAAGAVNATLICALPAAAVPMVGAPGTVKGVALALADAALLPAAFVAMIVQV